MCGEHKKLFKVGVYSIEKSRRRVWRVRVSSTLSEKCTKSDRFENFSKFLHMKHSLLSIEKTPKGILIDEVISRGKNEENFF